MGRSVPVAFSRTKRSMSASTLQSSRTFRILSQAYRGEGERERERERREGGRERGGRERERRERERERREREREEGERGERERERGGREREEGGRERKCVCVIIIHIKSKPSREAIHIHQKKSTG